MTLFELLQEMDAMRASLVEGISYRTPDVSFKAGGDVVHLPDIDAIALRDRLAPVLGMLWEVAAC